MEYIQMKLSDERHTVTVVFREVDADDRRKDRVNLSKRGATLASARGWSPADGTPSASRR